VFLKGLKGEQTIDGRTVEGRYAQALRVELLSAASSATFTGGSLSHPEPASVFDRLLVDQLVQIKLRLNALAVKLQAALAGNGRWTEQDGNTYNALVNQYRLLLRELRHKPVVRQVKNARDERRDDRRSGRRSPALPRVLLDAIREAPETA
jgi:hypothetical protein